MKLRITLLVLLPLLIGGVIYSGFWPARRGEHQRLVLYGNVEIRDAQLAFNEQEQVKEVLVEEGDPVEAGQVLARLEDDRLQDELAEARAQLDAQQHVLRKLTTGFREQEVREARAAVAMAEARLAEAKRDFQRQQQLLEERATSQDAVNNARTELDTAQAELRMKQAALDLAVEGYRQEDIDEAKARLRALEARVSLLNDRLNDTILRAPSRGIIQSRILEVGETAGPTRPAFVLALQQPKWVRSFLPEPQLGQVQPGMRARVLTDSFPDRAFDGWVGFISPQAEFTPKTVQTTDLRTQLVYEVRVWVEDPRDELRLGMPVTVEIDRDAPRREGPLQPTAEQDASSEQSGPSEPSKPAEQSEPAERSDATTDAPRSTTDLSSPEAAPAVASTAESDSDVIPAEAAP